MQRQQEAVSASTKDLSSRLLDFKPPLGDGAEEGMSLDDTLCGLAEDSSEGRSTWHGDRGLCRTPNSEDAQRMSAGPEPNRPVDSPFNMRMVDDEQRRRRTLSRANGSGSPVLHMQPGLLLRHRHSDPTLRHVRGF